MPMNTPSLTLTVKPEWIDHNGHMNVAYYVLAFDEATDAFYEEISIGLAYQKRGFSVYTLGMNVDYLKELFEGDPVDIQTLLIDADHKRIHYVHTMLKAGTDELVATNECFCMNVDLESKRSAPFPPDVNEAIQTLYQTQKSMPRPAQVGRTLGIRRK